MNSTQMYLDLMEVVKPVIITAGMLALTLNVIVMLINMLIDSFTGKGFHIGLRK